MMPRFTNKQVPLAWLLLAIIAASVTAIVWLAVTTGSPPANAVLIHNADNQTSTSSSIGQFGQDASQAQTSITGTPSPGTNLIQGKEQTLAIYVSGAVNKPGVYIVEPGSRVADAVEAAGGARTDADLEAVNLAAHVSDEEHISIPVLGSAATVAGDTGQPTMQATTTQATAGTHQPNAPKTRLNLNSATAKELEDLLEIGPVLAARIVAYRDQNGPFSTVEDLKRVSGIKDAVLNRLKDFVMVEP